MSKTNLKKKTKNNQFPIKGDANYIDRLEEDPPMKNKKFAVISFISPEGIRNTSLRGIKIRDVCADEEEAKKRAEEFRKLDSNKFDVFVGEIGKWLPYNPDRNSVKNQIYAESELNDLVHAQEDQMEKAKLVHKERKEHLKSYQNDPHRSDEYKKKMKAKVEKKLEAKKVVNEMPSKISSLCNETETKESLNDVKERELKEREKELEQKKKLLENKSGEILKNMQTVEQLESTKKDIDKLYKTTSGKTVPVSQDVLDITRHYENFKNNASKEKI
jgi:hypothetical protein